MHDCVAIEADFRETSQGNKWAGCKPGSFGACSLYFFFTWSAVNQHFGCFLLGWTDNQHLQSRKRKLTKFTNPQSKELSRRLTNWLKFTSKHFRARPGQKAHFYENWTHCQLNMAPTQLRGKTGFHCTAGSELAWNRTVLTNQDHWVALGFFAFRDSCCIIWGAITSSWCMGTIFQSKIFNSGTFWAIMPMQWKIPLMKQKFYQG